MTDQQDKQLFETDAERKAFKMGARAMFDNLLYRTANHWHANPEIQKICDRDNALVEEWVADALEELSEDDYIEWVSIGKAYKDGFAAGKRAAETEDNK